MYDDLDEIRHPQFAEIPESKLSESHTLPHVTIYSDGSYKPVIDYGGYGTLMSCGGHRLLIYGGSPSDSNNRMELTAVLTALRRLNRPCEVTVISDSQYVVNALNGYIWNWASNNWMSSKGTCVANADLWREMLLFCQIHRIHGQWIKGHAGHLENECCDRLATFGAYASASLPQPTPKTFLSQSKSQLPGDEDVYDGFTCDEIPFH